MKMFLPVLFVLICFNAKSQTDTLYTNSEKIACSVKEITPDAVRFAYPGEDLINSVYKNTIQKIVFKSGRVQTFAESTSYKTVKGAEDYENVALSQVESEVKGLFKVGDVSSKAKGTTVFSSMEKVKERAIKKLKIQAAMLGANIIYITQSNTSGNQYGTQYQAGKTTETNFAGVAYSNLLPVYNDFIKAIGDKKDFYAFEKYKLAGSDFDFEKKIFSGSVQLQNVYNENGLIMVTAKIDGVDNTTFRVISFTDNQFIISYKDGERIYNYRITI
ncbi:MAG TPA: hypothetical protein VHP12_07730 [Chitinophagaceae bacterium]|nr:hypothetical protein [Chitinophagaceae bacterium]